METILTDDVSQTSYHIGEPSEISAARRAGNDICRRIGFNEVKAGEVAIAVTEAGTNIVKHAGRGEIILRQLHHNSSNGIEILAIDSGPGMANAALQMEDGQSTAGTYGVGLGAMRRLADEFDFFSSLNKGTVLSMVFWDNAPAKQLWDTGVVCLPLAGERACGDAWAALEHDGDLSLAVADGLGHGPEAAAASAHAGTALLDNPAATPEQLLHFSHTAMRGSRGAAVAMARMDPYNESLQFAGVGNISACVIDHSERRHLLSHNGIVGANLRKVQQFSSAWRPGSLLVLHSDGIGTRWDLSQYFGLTARRSSVIAAVLYRDFARTNDDSTVVVVRQMPEH